MVLTLILTNAIIENLWYKMTVKVGEPFTLVMDKPEEIDDVFVNNDKVLDHEHNGKDINVIAKSVGVSKIRLMKDDTNPDVSPKVVREILVDVVETITRPASTLNTTFGAPEPK